MSNDEKEGAVFLYTRSLVWRHVQVSKYDRRWYIKFEQRGQVNEYFHGALRSRVNGIFAAIKNGR